VSAEVTLSDELGGYVGPMTLDEVLAALDEHTPGEWYAEMRDPDGRQLWVKSGWSWYGNDEGEKADVVVFAVAASEQAAGNPAVYVDAPLVLTFVRDLPMSAKCERYTNGLTLALGFGDYAMHTLSLVAWHGLLYETPSGEVAPW